MKSFFKFLLESAEQKQNIIQILKDNGYSDFKKGTMKRIVVKAGGSREEHLSNIERLFPNATWNKQNTKNSSVGVIELEDGFEIIIKPAFGGGSGAGAAFTKIVESAQCLYCAAALYGKGNYDKEDLESVKNHIDIDAKIENIIDQLPKDWHESSIITAEELKKHLGNKQYIFHRGSKWISDLEAHFLKLNREAGSPLGNVNKWTPADIWAVSSNAQTSIFDSKTLLELNGVLHEGLKTKDIVGISLKKVKQRAKVEFINFDRTRNDDQYKPVSYNIGSFKSKDVYLQFNGGQIQFRTFANTPASWQGEIKGKNANHGKVGGGIIHKILRRLFNYNAITPRSIDITDKRQVKIFFDKMKALNADIRDFESFNKQVQEKGQNWFLSKFLGVEIIHSIFIDRQVNPEQCVGAIISYAKSETDLSAPFIKVS
jgi:hypothetical protein